MYYCIISYRIICYHSISYCAPGLGAGGLPAAAGAEPQSLRRGLEQEMQQKKACMHHTVSARA